MKLFISHLSKDIKIVEPFVVLLQELGMNKENLFCSSVPGFGIPVGMDIYEYLRERLDEELRVVYILSDNYFASVPCLNEMGAAWMKLHSYMTLLLPGFEYREIKGAINAGQIGIKLDEDDSTLKRHLDEFKEILCQEFSLEIQK